VQAWQFLSPVLLQGFETYSPAQQAAWVVDGAYAAWALAVGLRALGLLLSAQSWRAALQPRDAAPALLVRQLHCFSAAQLHTGHLRWSLHSHRPTVHESTAAASHGAAVAAGVHRDRHVGLPPLCTRAEPSLSQAPRGGRAQCRAACRVCVLRLQGGAHRASRHDAAGPSHYRSHRRTLHCHHCTPLHVCVCTVSAGCFSLSCVLHCTVLYTCGHCVWRSIPSCRLLQPSVYKSPAEAC
jgi:hypothetical protein